LFLFYDAPTQNRSYGAKTGKRTLAKLSKQHQGSKSHHLLELREEYTPVIGTHLVASYNYAKINSGCNSYPLNH
jgi:hypothetical protein